MNAERDFIATVVDVMGDSVNFRQHFDVAHRHDPLRLTFAVVPLVNGKCAADRGEYGPAIGVRMLRVLCADRPEQHTSI